MTFLRICLTVFLVWIISAVAYAAPKANLLQQDVGYVNAGAISPFTLTSTTIANAVSGMGGVKGTLFLRPGTWTISANLVIPATVTLWIPSGTLVSVNAGMTLTIQGRSRIDGCGVFTGVGSVTFLDSHGALPCWFGVTGDGVTDDLAGLQKWVNAFGKACLTLPPGTFKVSGTLTITPGGGCLKGSGHGPFSATKIITSSATADIIYVSGQSITISDIQIRSSVTRTAGAHIHLDQVGGSSQNAVIERVYFGEAANAIYQQRSGGVTVRDNIMFIVNTSGTGVLIKNTDNGCDANMGVYTNNQMFGPSSSTVTNSRAFWVQAGGGLFLTNNTVFGWGYIVFLDPDVSCTAVALSEFTIAQNNLDGFTIAGIYAIAHVPRGLTTIKILGNNIGPVGGPSGTEGIVLTGNVAGVSITGGNQFGGTSGTRGIHVFSDGTTLPSLLHIGGNFFSGNGSDTAMYLDAGASLVSDNLINGFSITHNASSGIIVNDAGSNVTFANLGQSGGVKSRVWCTDCGVVNYTAPTCVGAGPGAWARRLTTAWICG